MELVVTGPGPSVAVPVPVPPSVPLGVPIAGNTTSIEITCNGGASEGIVKGLYMNGIPRGQFLAEDTSVDDGVNGIGVGDGFHDYLIAGFVACNHQGVLPVGR